MRKEGRRSVNQHPPREGDGTRERERKVETDRDRDRDKNRDKDRDKDRERDTDRRYKLSMQRGNRPSALADKSSSARDKSSAL